MQEFTVNKKDELIIKLLHYFITEEGYNPVILHGAKDEIWLENLSGDYKIVRIVSNYIHNNEQFEYDIAKTNTIIRGLKKKTLTFKMPVLSIFVDLGDNVKLFSSSNIDCAYLKKDNDIKNYTFITHKFPELMSKIKFNESGVQLFAKITSDINKKNEKENGRAAEIFKMKDPIMTKFLIGLNILLFLLMYFACSGEITSSVLLDFGALFTPLVRDGEYFRLMTSAFAHVSVTHIIVNMYSLYIIGSQIESFFGKSKYIIIYIFSAIFGSLMSMLFTTDAVSAGASGAIFGLLGAMLYFGYHYRVYLGNVIKSQIIPVIIFNLALGFIIPGIDNAAHIGGLVGGFLMANVLGIKYKKDKIDTINYTIITIIASAFMIYMAFFQA